MQLLRAVFCDRLGAAKNFRPYTEKTMQSIYSVMTIWLTGLPSSGKTTIGRKLAYRLEIQRIKAVYLDGDDIRKTVNKDLGFSDEDRKENIRRTVELVKLLNRLGIIVIAGFISPFRMMREDAKKKIGGAFFEVYVNAPLEVCEKRDVKGMYKQARKGELPGFTGVGAPYEPPEYPDIEVRTDLEDVETSVSRILVRLSPFLSCASK